METEVGKRIEREMLEAAQRRLERAAELGRLEREGQVLAKESLVLDGDIAAARRDRAPALDLEAVKAQGRMVLAGLREDLEREKALEQEKQREIERQRSKERDRGLGRDGPDYDLER